MQRLMMPDYLDGSALYYKDGELEITYAILWELAIYVSTNYHTETRSDKDIIFKDILGKIISRFKNVTVSEYDVLYVYNEYIVKSNFHLVVKTLALYFLIEDKKKKNFIICKTLSDSFSQISVNIKGKHLKESVGYIEFRDQTINNIAGLYWLAGLFFVVHKEDLVNTVTITFFCKRNRDNKNKNCTQFILRFKDDDNIHDKIKIENAANIYNLILNTIIYITHGCEELESIVNDFSPNKSRRQTEERFYTKKPYLLVGRNFQAPKFYAQSESPVRGHFKWRLCGPEQSELKLIWWNAHSRHYKMKAKNLRRE